MIDQELRQFIEGPVMLIIASVGDGRRMAIGRASGVKVGGGHRVRVFISRWQWPDTVDNLLRHPAAALTVASPVDYTCFQLKGRATLRPAGDDEVALADRYIADTYTLLSGLGIPTTTDSGWFSNRELWSVEIEVGAVFVQTPGPLAGSKRAAP
jgi:hypothetical protein